MDIYAISDLHLSFMNDKPMSVFSDNWKNHDLVIKQNFERLVKDDDLVLICGDVSWGMDLTDSYPDLAFVNDLPGKKILVQGNHDYYWKSTTKLNTMYDNMFFLKNDCRRVGDFFICGTRGWLCPNDTMFTKHDLKIYNRELGRLKCSLDCAARQGATDIIVMLHFPPTNNRREPSGFTELIRQYNVSTVLYGHLHTEASFGASRIGVWDGTRYMLTSADYLKFSPVKLT